MTGHVAGDGLGVKRIKSYIPFFLILNDTITTRQHLVAKSELFGRL